MKNILAILILSAITVLGQTNIVLTFTQEQLDAIAWRVSVLNKQIQAENAKIIEYNSKLKAETNEVTGEVTQPQYLKTNELLTVETYIDVKIRPQVEKYFQAIVNDLIKRQKAEALVSEETKQKLIDAFVNADAATRSNVVKILKITK